MQELSVKKNSRAQFINSGWGY